MAIWIQSGREGGGAAAAKRFGPVSVRYTSPSDMQFGIKRGGSHARTPRGGEGEAWMLHTEEFSLVVFKSLLLLHPNRHKKGALI